MVEKLERKRLPIDERITLFLDGYFGERDVTGDDQRNQEDEQLTGKEREVHAVAQREQMRRDLLQANYGGIRRDVFGNL